MVLFRLISSQQMYQSVSAVLLTGDIVENDGIRGKMINFENFRGTQVILHKYTRHLLLLLFRA